MSPLPCFSLARRLKSLAQCNEVLRCLKPRDWIQVAANVNSNRPNRRGVAKPESQCIAVIIDEVVHIDGAIYISPVIEDDSTQSFHNHLEWKPHLGIQNKKFSPSDRHRDVHASRLIF